MTMPADYFDDMYGRSPDPWGFNSRWYERRKYVVSMAALPHRRYGEAFEPGCSIGVLTELLADRCDHLLSCDISPAAVEHARRRVPQARVERRALPNDWPDGRFDLIVLSEVLYYFDDHDLAEVTRRTVDSLKPGGVVLAVHWRHEVSDYPQSGDDVHAVLAGTGLRRLVGHVEADFRCEVFVHGEATSVAAAEGLV